MKKFITLIFALELMLTNTNLNAQITTPSNVAGTGPEFGGWDGTGLNTKDFELKNNFAGQAMRFYTRPTGGTILERMVIADDGKVGIGTTAPSYKLDIKDGAGNCNMRLKAQNSGSANVVLSRFSATDNCLINYKTDVTSLWETGCLGDDDYRIMNATNVTDLIVKQSTGFIGVAIATPANQLHQYLAGNTNLYHQFSNANSGTNATDGFKIGLTYNATTTKSDAELFSQQSGANVNFYTNDGSGTTGRMSILSNGRVGVGDFGFTYDRARFQCQSSNEDIAVLGINTKTYPSVGTAIIGVRGQAFGTTTPYNFGGYFNASGSDGANVGCDAYAIFASSTATNYGGYFYAEASTFKNKGVHGNAIGSTTGNNYGGDFLAKNGATNYGVYASVANGCTTSSGCADYAGYFTGAIGTSAGYFVASDGNLKTNILPIANASQIINQLQPKSYEYDLNNYPQMALPSGNHFGFLAQEIETVLPNVVKNAIQPAERDSNGVETHPAVNYKMINYTEVIPILVSAIQ